MNTSALDDLSDTIIISHDVEYSDVAVDMWERARKLSLLPSQYFTRFLDF
jgi:hypothetical protein